MTYVSPQWTLLSLRLFLALCAGSRIQAAEPEGIFADFQSSMGSFTCRLDYAVAPQAVANLIGLATGQRAWLDPATGEARTNRYYDTLTFHRVIDGFMIQGGSPNGQGNDGPGYAFLDEFSPAQRFSEAGVLAMANSGTNSNGAQFFITVAPTPWLNDVHTIFGRVVGGMDVVTAISKVAVTNSRPLSNVVIQAVSVRRVGLAANDFDIHGQGLPVVENVPLAIQTTSNLVSLEFANKAYADNRLFGSTNLSTWSATALGIEVDGPLTNHIFDPVTGRSKFYTLAQVVYAGSTLAPKTLRGRELTLTINGGPVFTINFNAQGGGSYSYTGGQPGTVQEYTWQQEPYRGRLWPIYYSGFFPMTLRLDFRTLTNGVFSGSTHISGQSATTTGSFSLR